MSFNQSLFKALMAFDAELRSAGVCAPPDLVFHDVVDWVAATRGIPCIGNQPPTILGYKFRHQTRERGIADFVDEEIGG